MSINTQAILPGHLTVTEVGALLGEVSGVAVLGAEPTHRAEYKVLVFKGVDGASQTMDVFLDSYAAADYHSTFSGESTLISLPFSQENFKVVGCIARKVGGLVRRIEREDWSDAASGAPSAP